MPEAQLQALSRGPRNLSPALFLKNPPSSAFVVASVQARVSHPVLLLRCNDGTPHVTWIAKPGSGIASNAVAVV